MRNAILISLVVHVAAGFIALRLVRISQVRFVPREVYAVNWVSLQEAAKPKKEEMEASPKESPRETPKEIDEKKPDELVPPVKQPKPRKKEEPKKAVPSTRVDERHVAQSAEADTAKTKGAVTTGDMALDVDDFPFAYYLATVKRKIAANWQVPGTTGGPVHCRVYFRITRSGSIDSRGIEISSGNFLFDQAALRAVVQADPLPALPDGFGDEYLGVHFSFAYEEE